MNTLSVVIPTTDFTGQPWRGKALSHVGKRIAEHLPLAEIIISKGEPGPEFCKAKLVNDGVAKAAGNVVLILDSDVVLNWGEVAKAVQNLKPGTVYKPFSTIIRMTESMTNTAYATGNVLIPNKVDRVSVLGGGAVILFKSDFEKVGGFCEDFIGWGWEDNDFGDKLKRAYKIEEIDKRGFHLFHPRCGADLVKTATAVKNHALFSARKKMRETGKTYNPEQFAALPIIEKESEVMQDTALIFAYYGDNPIRRQAVRKGLAQIRKLNPMPKVVFLEVGNVPQFKETFEGWPGAIYKNIPDAPKYRRLMLKESLYNKGAALVPECDVLLFGDPDAYSIRQDWAGRYRAEILRLGENAAVQGFGAMTDDETGIRRASYASERLANKPYCSACPGLYWGFNAAFFREKMKGWNPFYICGSGDGGFVIAHVPSHRYPTHTSTDLACYSAIFRKDQPPVKLGIIDDEFIHCGHGARAYNPKTGEEGRGYVGRWYIIEMFGPDAIREHCELDELGILSWKNPGSVLEMALSRRGETESKKDAVMVVEESRRGMHLIRQAEYTKLAAADPYYSRFDRWSHFYLPAMDMLRAMPPERFGKPMLEFGSSKLPLNRLSIRMDMEDLGLENAVLHDARKSPWPFADKQFSTVVALHVLEHLDGKQPEALAEIARIADTAIIALPYKWEKGTPHHLGLAEKTLENWLAGLPGKITEWKITGPRNWRQMLAKWEIEK